MSLPASATAPPGAVSSVLDLIGKTPLVRLPHFERLTPGVELYAKAEWQNPGGSVKDPEVIASADERDVAMVFTGTRHFRH